MLRLVFDTAALRRPVMLTDNFGMHRLCCHVAHLFIKLGAYSPLAGQEVRFRLLFVSEFDLQDCFLTLPPLLTTPLRCCHAIKTHRRLAALLIPKHSCPAWT